MDGSSIGPLCSGLLPKYRVLNADPSGLAIVSMQTSLIRLAREHN